jgi:hypothetical protein
MSSENQPIESPDQDNQQPEHQENSDNKNVIYSKQRSIKETFKKRPWLVAILACVGITLLAAIALLVLYTPREKKDPSTLPIHQQETQILVIAQQTAEVAAAATQAAVQTQAAMIPTATPTKEQTPTLAPITTGGTSTTPASPPSSSSGYLCLIQPGQKQYVIVIFGVYGLKWKRDVNYQECVEFDSIINPTKCTKKKDIVEDASGAPILRANAMWFIIPNPELTEQSCRKGGSNLKDKHLWVIDGAQ